MNNKYLIVWLLLVAMVVSCKKDSINDLSPGNPVLEVKMPTLALFGDNLPFTATVSDHIPLSTLIIELYFGDEKVSEKVIRTTQNGVYSDSIFVPFLKEIPNGKAQLMFTLTDIHTTKTKQIVEINLSRPVFPYLILVTEKQSYPMLPTGVANEYTVSESFPSTDLPAYIKSPIVGNNGTEITFGWDAGKIKEGVTDYIPFSSSKAGKFTVSFNSLSYEANPFFELFIDGQKMVMQDKENLILDKTFTQNQEVTITGIDLAEWWIDPDFFKKTNDLKQTFVPLSGKYRIIANTTLKYFRVQVLEGNNPAVLQEDGSGAIWIIGENIGKPNVANNQVGWNAGNALCMAPIGNKKYQVTVDAGNQVDHKIINFKFFHQLGWGTEFTTGISTTSNLVYIGDGSNGRDPGNLGLQEGVTLETGASYIFIVDVSAGNDKAVLTVQKK